MDIHEHASTVSAQVPAENTTPMTPMTRWDAFKAWAHDWWDDVVALNGIMLAGPDIDMSQWPPAKSGAPGQRH